MQPRQPQTILSLRSPLARQQMIPSVGAPLGPRRQPLTIRSLRPPLGLRRQPLTIPSGRPPVGQPLMIRLLPRLGPLLRLIRLLPQLPLLRLRLLGSRFLRTQSPGLALRE